MSKPDDDGHIRPTGSWNQGGLTRKDYIAIKVMVVLVAGYQTDPKVIANMSYLMADEMIARSKQETPDEVSN